MKKIYILLIAIIVFLALYYFQNPLRSKVRVGNTVFTVDLALTEPQKQTGLGGRSDLPQESGMLFVYDHKEQYNFWMRGMQFPLDFIWIDGNTVADITENVPPPKPGESPQVVVPAVLVDKILEVNAGTVKRTGIRIGDTVTFLDR